MLDTDQLRSFMAIVDTGSFTRAAERVHKTQSAVSMHIRRLEEQLGRPLFVKNGRGVRLSGDGDRLVDFAREMLRIEATALMHVGQKGLEGSVRLESQPKIEWPTLLHDRPDPDETLERSVPRTKR